jgi:hypothetical protein
LKAANWQPLRQTSLLPLLIMSATVICIVSHHIIIDRIPQHTADAVLSKYTKHALKSYADRHQNRTRPAASQACVPQHSTNKPYMLCCQRIDNILQASAGVNSQQAKSAACGTLPHHC